jgi:hypothetical protein
MIQLEYNFVKCGLANGGLHPTALALFSTASEKGFTSAQRQYQQPAGGTTRNKFKKYEVEILESILKWICCADRRTEIKGSHSFLVDLHSSRRMGCNYIKMYVSLLEGALGHRNFLFEFVSYSETAAREREKGNNPTRRFYFLFFFCYMLPLR